MGTGLGCSMSPYSSSLDNVTVLSFQPVGAPAPEHLQLLPYLHSQEGQIMASNLLISKIKSINRLSEEAHRFSSRLLGLIAGGCLLYPLKSMASCYYGIEWLLSNLRSHSQGKVETIICILMADTCSNAASSYSNNLFCAVWSVMKILICLFQKRVRAIVTFCLDIWSFACEMAPMLAHLSLLYIHLRLH